MLDDHGLAICPQCDPDRQASLLHSPEKPSPGFVKHLLQTTRLALLRPGELVQSVSAGGELAPALKFGLLAIILGKLIFLLWILLLERETYVQAITPLAEQLNMTVQTYQVLQVALLPLDALARLALFGLLLRLGVRLAVGPDKYQYRDFVRMFCYASSGYLLLVVPLFFGMALSFSYIIYLSFRIVRHRFALTNPQAVIAIVPLGLALLFLEFLGGL